MHSERDQIRRALALANEAMLFVRVAKTQGSTPREAGAMMLVAAQTHIGSIGGGHLEYQALIEARGMLAEASSTPLCPVVRSRRYSLAASLGQCCGGVVHLQFALWRPGEAYPSELGEQTAPRLPLVLFGAGHVGCALVRTLAPLPIDITWVDERESLLAAAVAEVGPTLPGLTVAAESAERVICTAPAASAFLVMTHSHADDFELGLAILRRRDFVWFGMIGSATKAARFKRRYRERGVVDCDRLRCPVGVDGIVGKEPAVIALAIAAELMQVYSSVHAAITCDGQVMAAKTG